ncbi:MAG TPA: alpha/beta fold hydrolase [Albitalea sp.]
MPTREQPIDVPLPSGRLQGTLVTPGSLIPGVLFVHGWGGSQRQYLARAREVAALGCVCLTFDLSGHEGTNEHRGTVSRETNLRDVLAAYDLLASHSHVDPSAIAVVGSSYGGYLAAILTTLRRVKWLALRVPALYIDSGWELPKLELHKVQDLRSYRRSFVPAESNRALRACAAYRGDVLIVQSERDDIIPAEVITSYREACLDVRSLTYRCMAGADHGLTDEASQRSYTMLLMQWLGEMLPGARRDGVVPPAEAAATSREAAEAAAGAEPAPETPLKPA